MKRLLLILLMIAVVLVPGAQAQDNEPAINAFTSSVTEVSSSALQNRSARVPVAWEVVNRPLTANLFFEQVFADGSSINVELPRLIPWVASSGSGVVAPVDPGAGEPVIIRLRLADLLTQKVYSTAQIELNVTEGGEPGTGSGGVPTITSFSAGTSPVSRDQLADGTARVSVSWATANRPATANLFFEQILPDVGPVNVELPRTIPWVASSGSGVVAPRDPGEGVDQIRLRVRLVDLVNSRVYDQRDQLVRVVEGGPPQAVIGSFTVDAQSVNATQLDNGTVRIPVSWSVDSRPDNSNLVFEQVLADGSVVNIELPRDNPIIPSSGNGVVAPVPPGGDATEIQLQVRLINLTDNSEYDKLEHTIPINTAPVQEPEITTFSTSAASVSASALSNRTARVPVTWDTANRPLNSNLVFEQVLADGSIVNVELPRTNPIVPSSGVGTMAPRSPGGDATEITLQVRLIDISSKDEYAKREITLPITEVPGAMPAITDFSASVTQVNATSLENGTARVPVTWATRNRPANSNLVFEQVLADGTVKNVELPRTNPVVPSSGIGVVAPVSPGGDAVEIQLQVRLIDITDKNEYDKREITLPIVSTPVQEAKITRFTTGTLSVDASELQAGTARVPVFWATVNRPDNSNLIFEQRMPDDTVKNIELPRTDPIVPSTGVGVVAPVWPGDNQDSVILTLRLVNLSNDETIDEAQIDFPISGLTTSDENTTGDTSSDTNTDTTSDAGGGAASTTCGFTDTFNPDSCPTSQADVPAVYQTYEHGMMVWRGDTRQIYVLYEDSSYWVYPDTWTEDQPADTGETPPDGLVLPERGFGKVWANESGVRDRLGWATGDEIAYSTKLEVYESPDEPNVVYMLIPDGRTLIISGDWKAQ